MGKTEAVAALERAEQVRTRGHALGTPNGFPVLAREHVAGLLAGWRTLPEDAWLPVALAEGGRTVLIG